MYPVLLEIGRFKLYSFGTFIALGAIAAGVFAFLSSKSKGLKTHHIFDTVLYTLIIGLIGARLGYYFAYQNQFQNFWQVFYFWQGGLIAVTGIALGFISFLYFVKKQRDPIWQSLDIGALAFLIAWAIGKTGCFLSGCSIGRPTTFLAINGSYPVDLFSAIWAAILYFVLIRSWSRGKLSDGVIFFLSLEGLFLGELLIRTLDADFGEGIARIQAMVYLGLIVLIYGIFWKIHGPKIEKASIGNSFRSLVFRRKKKL